MAKTEDIEAKLAAYVDGEIDQAGRAEIEKHLASHAQHRQLIKELMAQRDLLRGLPREVAPLEVSESVNASLERAVLLGDVDGESDSGAMQIRPWSQFRAIAAILFFTASLAAVIYYLLPSPNHKPELASDLRQSSPVGVDAVAPSDRAEKQDVPGPLAFSAANPIIAPTTAPAIETAAITEQQRRSAVALRDFGLGGGTLVLTNSEPMLTQPVVSNVASNGSIAREMFQNLATPPAVEPLSSLPIAAPSQVFVMLSSANTEQASREVTRYLTRSNIAWETPAEPMPAPLEIDIQQQRAVASRLQTQSVQLKSAGMSPTTQVAMELNLPGNSSPSTTPSQELDRNSFAGAAGSNRISAGQGFGAGTAGGRGGGGRGGAAAGGLTLETPSQASTERRIIARRLNRQQAAEVQSAVNAIASQFNPNPLVARDAAAASIAMSGFSSREEFVDRQSQTLAEALEKRLGTTMPAELRAQLAPTTLPEAATSQPAPVAAGAAATQPAEVASIPRFDAGAVNFSLAPTPTSGIDFRAPTPTTVEAIAGTLSIAAAPPATAPATSVAADWVDVIIVVQPEPAAVPTTAPALP